MTADGGTCGVFSPCLHIPLQRSSSLQSFLHSKSKALIRQARGLPPKPPPHSPSSLDAGSLTQRIPVYQMSLLLYAGIMRQRHAIRLLPLYLRGLNMYRDSTANIHCVSNVCYRTHRPNLIGFRSCPHGIPHQILQDDRIVRNPAATLERHEGRAPHGCRKCSFSGKECRNP